MKIIDKKEFAKLALDENVKALVMHLFSLVMSLMLIYPAKKTEITLLLTKEVKIPTKYSDFSNIFLEKNASVLPELAKLN